MGGVQVAKNEKMEVSERQKVEMADAHCHLDLIKDNSVVLKSIEKGVLTIVTDGIDLLTSRVAVKISSLNMNVFAAVGIDPENAIRTKNIVGDIVGIEELIEKNRKRVVAIGEIGLDYKKATTMGLAAKQKQVFALMLDLAKRADLPVSVHSRDALADVIAMLREKEMERVQLHFFEGDVLQAKEAEKLGYMISIPPIDSSKRRRVIKEISIDYLMAESDSPVVGDAPSAVERSIALVASVKGLDFARAAEQLTANTKRFFGTGATGAVMRS